MLATQARAWMRPALAGLALLVTTVVSPGTRADVANELVVADQRAGIALFGFDPVSYFLDGAPRDGLEAFEVSFGRMTWRFRNEANRTAFRVSPDVYVPQFGGYDPIALARSAPVAGHPALFVVREGQLFLFYEPETRGIFLADPERHIAAAGAAWPRVRRSLVH